MSEHEKQILEEIKEGAKKLDDLGKAYIKGVIDGKVSNLEKGERCTQDYSQQA